VLGGTAELLGDADRDGAWMLLVNSTPQSHVDLDDPAHLEFEYVRRIGHVLDLAAEEGAPLDVVHLGGGAGANPSLSRHCQIMYATLCPHSIPALTDPASSTALMALIDALRFAVSAVICVG